MDSLKGGQFDFAPISGTAAAPYVSRQSGLSLTTSQAIIKLSGTAYAIFILHNVNQILQTLHQRIYTRFCIY